MVSFGVGILTCLLKLVDVFFGIFAEGVPKRRRAQVQRKVSSIGIRIRYWRSGSARAPAAAAGAQVRSFAMIFSLKCDVIERFAFLA